MPQHCPGRRRETPRVDPSRPAGPPAHGADGGPSPRGTQPPLDAREADGGPRPRRLCVPVPAGPPGRPGVRSGSVQPLGRRVQFPLAAQSGRGGRHGRLRSAAHGEELRGRVLPVRSTAEPSASSSGCGSGPVTSVPSPCRTSGIRIGDSARTASRRELRDSPGPAASSLSPGQPVAGTWRAGDDHPLDLLGRLVGDRRPGLPADPLGTVDPLGTDVRGVRAVVRGSGGRVHRWKGRLRRPAGRRGVAPSCHRPLPEGGPLPRGQRR